jgi:hypothetical protein
MSVVPIAPLFGTTYGSDLSGFSVFIPRGTRYIPICLAENIIANAISKGYQIGTLNEIKVETNDLRG